MSGATEIQNLKSRGMSLPALRFSGTRRSLLLDCRGVADATLLMEFVCLRSGTDAVLSRHDCNDSTFDSARSHDTNADSIACIDPFAEADEDSGQTTQTQEYIHIRIQQRNGRKTLTTVQGIPSKFDHKKILKVIKKEFACNGTIISDTESKGMGEVIQLQGDHRLKIKDFLVNEETGLGLDEKTIKIHGF
jgi:translation initiation factor 1